MFKIMNNVKKIIEQDLKLYNKLKEDENGRYHSWEYCYKIFNDAHKSINVDDNYIDYLCLHLAFYLASLGMYRGSSFLLQKDYKVHKPIIQELLKSDYDSLWGIDVNDYEKNIETLFKLVDNLRKLYDKIRQRVKENIPKSEVSDTLITKVLMGTLGCVPAYDKYFILGIKQEKILGKFSKESILALVDFYNKNYEDFEKARSQMKAYELDYPQMKIIDSFFWQIGKDL